MTPPRSASGASPPGGRHLRPGKAGSAVTREWNPLRLVRNGFQQWWQSRLPLTDSMLLTQRNVYILPTRPGLMLALTLMVLLIASINYQLNLGYLLTFLLAGSAVTGMHVCHATLRGLAMNLIAPQPQYAGAAAVFDIKLTNTRNATRYGIGLSVLEGASGEQDLNWTWTDVPAQNSSTVQVAFRPRQRGRHTLPALTAETRFPLGTFRVWTIWRPAAQMLVYPAPEKNPPPLPPGEPRAGAASATARVQSSGDFDGIRGYRRGDPLKLVMWKKAAKADEQGNGLVVRDAQQAQRHELWLDFMQAGVNDAEGRLSRLCAWVLQADRLGINYGLRLPGVQIKPSSGEAHKRQCLEALALC